MLHAAPGLVQTEGSRGRAKAWTRCLRERAVWIDKCLRDLNDDESQRPAMAAEFSKLKPSGQDRPRMKPSGEMGGGRVEGTLEDSEYLGASPHWLAQMSVRRGMMICWRCGRGIYWPNKCCLNRNQRVVEFPPAGHTALPHRAPYSFFSTPDSVPSSSLTLSRRGSLDHPDLAFPEAPAQLVFILHVQSRTWKANSDWGCSKSFSKNAEWVLGFPGHQPGSKPGSSRRHSWQVVGRSLLRVVPTPLVVLPVDAQNASSVEHT
ncbi:hypothetical protein FB451DRAFT_1478539 [Mycena latifolia]|nr:hypothetical protein FB451DRAFT_1478539 [Mycena latifolia]